MAHLVYKKPLVNEKARERYLQSRKDLSQQKKGGLLDPESYRAAKQRLLPTTLDRSDVREPSLNFQCAGYSTGHSSPILGRSSSVSSAGTRTDRSSSVPSADAVSVGTSRAGSVSGQGLTRTMTESSVGTKAKPKRGTIFDRNDVGRLVYKPNAQSEHDRELIKKEKEAKKQLKILMQSYETSQRSIAYNDLYPAPPDTPSPFEPVADSGTSTYYPTEPLAPVSTNSATSSTSVSAPKKKNFNFFKWSGGAKSPASPAGEPTNVIDLTPRKTPYLQAPAAANSHISLSGSMQSIFFSTARPTTTNTAAATQHSRAPSAPKNPSLHSEISEAEDMTAELQPPTGAKDPYTLADYFLIGSSGTVAAERRRRSNLHPEPNPWWHASKGLDVERPGSSNSITSSFRRRRHSISSEYSYSTSPRPSTDLPMQRNTIPAVVTEPATGDIGFVFPFHDSSTLTYRQGLGIHREPTLLYSSHSIAQQEPRVVAPHSEQKTSLPALSSAPEYLIPPVPSSCRATSEKPGLQYSTNSLASQSSLPSSILLDAFIALIEEYTSMPKLFSFTRPRPAIKSAAHHSRKSSLASLRTTATSGSARPQGAIKEEEDTESCSDSISVLILDDSDGDLQYYFGDSPAEAEAYLTAKQKLEQVVWFSMASKWLSFGRLLFSPGHHLLNLGTGDGYTLAATGTTGVMDEMRVLDLDGFTIGWSWHLSYEYPSALIFNTTTDPVTFSTYGKRVLHPPNHRLVRVYSPTDLHPLESNFFDVITARTLPRTLQRNEWIPLLKECHRVLKPDGYLELTIIDPLLNNMGPVTKQWITDNIIQPTQSLPPSPSSIASSSSSLSSANSGGGFDPRPTKSILTHLEATKFVSIHKCWVWMPASSIGDELSMVTSRVGRYFYDELFADWGRTAAERVSETSRGEMEDYDGSIGRHRELNGLWGDKKVQEECVKENTAFRWLKCHARKSI